MAERVGNVAVPAVSGQHLTEDATSRTNTRSRNRRLSDVLRTSPRHSSLLRQSIDEAPELPSGLLEEHVATQTRTMGTHTRKKRRFNAMVQRLNWNWKWDGHDWNNGRVLIIDYISQDYLRNGRPQIAAQEIHSLSMLRKCLENHDRSKKSALRVIHVQNASWATHLFIEKYNISTNDDLTGVSFGRWAKFEKPEWRGGRPSLRGKTWRVQSDPWRKVRRSAFGMDYLKHYPRDSGFETEQFKMMELNSYDENDGPCYGYDVFIQRLSVYMQFKDSTMVAPEDLPNPYDQNIEPEKMEYHDDFGVNSRCYKPHKLDKLPAFDSLENGNTIIIFENSQSGSVKDTLMAARDEMESRWRRLSFFLPKDIASSDERLVFHCANAILQDVFRGLAFNWDVFLNKSETHVGILEDKIYESPADETRAPELWNNSKTWLRVEKLMTIHMNMIQEVTERLRELWEDVEDSDSSSLGRSTKWLEGMPDEFNKLSNMVQESLVKPTESLNDLMYKSVGIRDSRHSLTLNDSLWRLSWITFIFLPLSFTVGFFGMNVDTFKNDPDIKWFFVAAIPLMVIVLLSIFFFKRAINSWWQTPYQRGVYEHMFHDLAIAHPNLWSRVGPRRYVEPVGFMSRVKWRLLNYWFDPAKTIAIPGNSDEDMGGSGFGVWGRLKRRLAQRWLRKIKATRRSSISTAELAENGDVPAATEMLALATNIAAAEGEPNATALTLDNIDRLNIPVKSKLANGTFQRSHSRSHSGVSGGVSDGARPTSSVGSSGGGGGGGGGSGGDLIIEEQEPYEDEDMATDDNNAQKRSHERIPTPNRSEILNVSSLAADQSVMQKPSSPSLPQSHGT